MLERHSDRCEHCYTMRPNCVLTLGQRVKPCKTHPTAGARLGSGAEESRTPSTDTTGSSRQAGVVVRHDVAHNSKIGSYSPAPFLAVWPPACLGRTHCLPHGCRKVVGARGHRSCPFSPTAASCGGGESRGNRQVTRPTYAR